MRRLLTCALLLLTLPLCAQTVTPNLDLTLPNPGARNWGFTVNNNFLILDTTYPSSDCGDPTHAVKWNFATKRLGCQSLSGTGNLAFSDLTTGTNTVPLLMGTGGSLNVTGSGTINSTTLLGSTWAIPASIGATTPAAGAFTSLNSDQVVDAASKAGTHWTDKVVAAYGSAACASGCTIVIPDSIADNGAATTPAIPSNVVLVFPGVANFTFCAMTTGKFTKIYAHGAVFVESGSNCPGIEHLGATAILQDYDHFVLDGVRVNCVSQATSTGITDTPSSGGAQDEFTNVSVTGCTTVGIQMTNVQFGNFTNLMLEQNYVNLKVYGVLAGSSNTFTALKSASPSSGVGVILYNSASAQITTGNVFVNPTIQNGTIASFAVIGNSTCGTTCTSATIIEASPELNGGGAASVTIDGNVIPQSGFLYQKYSQVTLKNPDFEDATATTEINLTNYSNLNIEHPQGYGPQFGNLVAADSTSFVNVSGTLTSNGSMANVTSYPSTIGGGRGAMAGAPVSYLNSAVPNFFLGNALTPPFSSTTGTSSNAIANDATYGQLNTVTFAASAGSAASNEIQIANAIPAGATAVTSDYVFSILVMASVTTKVSFYSQYSGGNSGFISAFGNPLTLQGGQWTRVLMYSFGIGAGNSAFLTLFPADSAGATVSFTRLESLAYPSGSGAFTSLQGASIRAQILQSGAVNPNNGNCSAVGTSASPSVASCSNASQGNFSCATAATGATCQVNTTRVTANSQIYVQEDETQGTKIGVTCNTGTTVIPTSRLLASKVAGTSFTINLGTVTTNPACFSYRIDN